jgi:hypothetical protein
MEFGAPLILLEALQPASSSKAEEHESTAASPNVILINMSQLQGDAKFMTGDPTVCTSCGGILNSKSHISKEGIINQVRSFKILFRSLDM